jgi:hypothetical protein
MHKANGAASSTATFCWLLHVLLQQHFTCMQHGLLMVINQLGSGDIAFS